MRNGTCFRRPPLVPLTSVRGLSLLPTPTAFDAQNLAQYLRKGETWPKATYLTKLLIGVAFNFKDRELRPPYRLIVEPLFVEWMMGVPTHWTDCGVSATASCLT